MGRMDEIVEILNDKLTIIGNGRKIGSAKRAPISNPIINIPEVTNVIEINSNVFDVAERSSYGKG